MGKVPVGLSPTSPRAAHRDTPSRPHALHRGVHRLWATGAPTAGGDDGQRRRRPPARVACLRNGARRACRGTPISRRSRGGELQRYCVKCKEKRDFDGEVKVSESGRRMAQGTCPVCGTKMNRILGKA